MVLITATAGIWEAMEMLNTLVDDSDPDVRRQSAEPCRDAVMLTFIADECISDRAPLADGGSHPKGRQA